jgi:flagellar hook-length control protein FliK
LAQTIPLPMLGGSLESGKVHPKATNRPGNDTSFSNILKDTHNRLEGSKVSELNVKSPMTIKELQASNISEIDVESRMTVLARLKKILEETGLSVTDFLLAKEDLPFLIDLLKQSGFSTEEIEKAMSQISVKGGSINLGEFFSALEDSLEVTAGNKLKPTLERSALPIMQKILSDLGMKEGDLKMLKQQLSEKGGTISLDDLRRIIGKQLQAEAPLGNIRTPAEVSSNGIKGAQMEEVKELLVKAGISLENVDNLLQEMGIQGERITGENLIELLKRASMFQTQDQTKTASQSENTTKILSAKGASECNVDTILENLLNKVTIKEGVVQKAGGENQLISPHRLFAKQQDRDGFKNQDPGSRFREFVAPKNEEDSSPKIADGNEEKIPLSNKGNHPFEDMLNNLGSVDNTQANCKAAKVSARQPDVLPQIIRPLTESITSLSYKGTERVEIQLHPPHLGRLEIDLTLKDNNLEASFVTQNFLVKEILELHVDQLRQAFLNQGIHLKNFHVSVGYEANPWDKRQYSEGQRQGRGWDWGEEEAEEIASDVGGLPQMGEKMGLWNIDLLV